MKKASISFILITLYSAFAVAQIPNSGFENWTNAGAYNTPDGWGNLNPNTAIGNVYTCTKGSPGKPGNAYLNLTSKSVLGTVVPGVAVSGRLNTATYHADKGFPCSNQPESLSGNWQYMAYGNDQGLIAIVLTKWNASTHFSDTVAFTKYLLPGMVMSWASFNIPIDYRSVEPADTAMIILSASGAKPVANSYLAIDNLSFTGSVMGIQSENRAADKLNVYPVPAKENIRLEYESKQEEQLTIQLCDMLGNLLYEHTVETPAGISKITLPVNACPKGLYIVRVTSSQGQIMRKITVE